MSAALAVKTDLLVDVSELAFADVSVMLDLALVARRLRQAGRRIVVRGAAPQIATLIELVGLHRMPGVTVEFAQSA